MDKFSRRGLLAGSPVVGAAAVTGKTVHKEGVSSEVSAANHTRKIDLCTSWQFRIDPEGVGEKSGWQAEAGAEAAWQSVTIPHTWQIEDKFVNYRGDAWYEKRFFVPGECTRNAVRIEFEAVFHSATVWINGKLAGEHLRKGYTAFAFYISPLLRWGQNNTVTVRVSNAFNQQMLPRGRSSDWAHDGGIYRPVRLLITDRLFAQSVDVDANPDFDTGNAELHITSHIRSMEDGQVSGAISAKVIDEETGEVVLADKDASPFRVSKGNVVAVSMQRTLNRAKLWHFDHPYLYRLELTTRSSAGSHLYTTTFGVRRFEVKDRAFYLNNEKVVLTGVERMAGSNPEFGMAEPSQWVEHDHRDLKDLNCVFTRVHWPQDKRVLDFCDRHGILMQEEVPTWGPATFAGMSGEPDEALMQNGREQLREMVSRDRNHPCIVSWGLCNEIGGQNPPAYAFAKNMLAEAKRLDPTRLCSYASHSLFKDQAKDVSALMDFVECNEYLGSWQRGGPTELSRLLDAIHTALPDKAVVISEYGYCACTADRSEGDGHRMAVLAEQNAVLRTKLFVAGAIFFCYNDYRTHVGDRGEGVMQQRVHGVVDVYGQPKPSHALLRTECSPIASFTFENFPSHVLVRLRTRSDLPSYVLREYTVRGVFYESANIPVKRVELPLPELTPGAETSLSFTLDGTRAERIVFDVLRPTKYSISALEWRR